MIWRSRRDPTTVYAGDEGDDYRLGLGDDYRSGLPEWFWRLSPLTMDALKGPDMQYRAGAKDMLSVLIERGVLRDEDVR